MTETDPLLWVDEKPFYRFLCNLRGGTIVKIKYFHGDINRHFYANTGAQEQYA